MPSHLPPSRLSENDMQIILQSQGRVQQMQQYAYERHENIYNRGIHRPNVLMGNWFEEQNYWDAMEDRDVDMDTNSIIANPLVVSKDNYHTSNEEYGSTIKDADVDGARASGHMLLSHDFENRDRLHHERESHQIFEDKQYDMKYRRTPGASMRPISSTYQVTLHRENIQ